MYKIRVTKDDHSATEGYLTFERAIERFDFLCAYKKYNSLDMHIYLEELVDSRIDEFKVHKVG